MAQTVAALYVETGGVYFGLPDVDPWDEARDARLYAGPWPVVAHPPCARWSNLAHIHKHRWPIGSDEGCFESALTAVQTWGGVLEHPAGSLAWDRFVLPRPIRGGCQPGERWYAHRWAYTRFVGAIPDGMHVHHRCHTPSCVNTAHMEVVTPKEHALLSEPAQRTHCPHGHAYDEKNTYRFPSGRRKCRACHAEGARARRSLAHAA